MPVWNGGGIAGSGWEDGAGNLPGLPEMGPPLYMFWCRAAERSLLLLLVEAIFEDLKEIKDRKMASNFVSKEDHHDYRQHYRAPSPPGVRRTWSSNSSACGQGAVPKCVCAPATHAGSFKCRLHRTSSHGHTPASPTSIPPPPRVNTSRAPTVEAQ